MQNNPPKPFVPKVIVPVDADGQPQSTSSNGQRTTIKGGFVDTPDEKGRSRDGDPYDDSDPGAGVFLVGDRGASGAIVPLGNIEESDVVAARGHKPQLKEKKTKWTGKGESLTTATAIEFMIKERALMDQETAQLRRDNEKLRRSLEVKQNQPVMYPPPTALLTARTDGEEADKAALQGQLDRLKEENERLKLQHLTEHGSSQNSGELGVDLPAPPGGASSAELQRQMFPGDPQGGLSPLVQRGALNDMRKGSNSNGSNPFGKGVEGQITISSLIWDGGYLWKIPYNGKGSPEKRIVSIKRSSVHPSPGSRAVCIDRNGTLSKPDNFIAYPPTLTWYNSDKPGQVKNARELILYEGTCLMEGHNTNAFYKLASKDKPLPRPELCFSMMTTTRSLDMAAESVKDADMWKAALHTLLIEFSPNKQWAIENLRRDKPFWNNKSTELAPPPGPGMHSPPPPALEHSPAPSASKRPMRKEAIKKQLFAAARAGDERVLESMFRAGVPVNLMDDSGENSDTPLMIACRGSHTTAIRVCLEYGAKNDPHPDFGETALHVAAETGAHEAVSIILAAAAQSDADHMISNLTNEEKKTPLHLAAARGYRDVADLLLAHGASLTNKDELDQTALHVCSAQGHTECLATLLDQGGDNLLEYPDLGGNTALHHAAQNGHRKCLQLLLETAADAMVRNTGGQTAYKLAMDAGHQSLAKLLLEYMKDFKATSTSRASSSRGITSNGGRRNSLSVDVSDTGVDEDGVEAIAALGYSGSGGGGGGGTHSHSHSPQKGEVAMEIRSFMPASPTSQDRGLSTPSKGVPQSAYADGRHLPRPHSSQSSPQLGSGQKQNQSSGPFMSPGNGAYRVVSKQGAGTYGTPDNRNRSASADVFTNNNNNQYPQGQTQGQQYQYDYSQQQQHHQQHQQSQGQVHSPVPYHGSPVPVVGGSGYPQGQHSSLSPYANGHHGPNSAREVLTPSHAQEAYSPQPMSARERPTPNMHNSQQMHHQGNGNEGYDSYSHSHNSQYQQHDPYAQPQSQDQNFYVPQGGSPVPHQHQYAQQGQYDYSQQHEGHPVPHPQIQRSYSDPAAYMQNGHNDHAASTSAGPRTVSGSTGAPGGGTYEAHVRNQESYEKHAQNYSQQEQEHFWENPDSGPGSRGGTGAGRDYKHDGDGKDGENEPFSVQVHSQEEHSAWESGGGGGHGGEYAVDGGAYDDNTHTGGAGDGETEGEIEVVEVGVNGGRADDAFEDALEEFTHEGVFFQVYCTEDGHTYYLDAATEHSQWEDPRTYGIVVAEEGVGGASDGGGGWEGQEEYLEHSSSGAAWTESGTVDVVIGSAASANTNMNSNSTVASTAGVGAKFYNYRGTSSSSPKSSPPKSPTAKSGSSPKHGGGTFSGPKSPSAFLPGGALYNPTDVDVVGSEGLGSPGRRFFRDDDMDRGQGQGYTEQDGTTDHFARVSGGMGQAREDDEHRFAIDVAVDHSPDHSHSHQNNPGSVVKKLFLGEAAAKDVQQEGRDVQGGPGAFRPKQSVDPAHQKGKGGNSHSTVADAKTKSQTKTKGNDSVGDSAKGEEKALSGIEAKVQAIAKRRASQSQLGKPLVSLSVDTGIGTGSGGDSSVGGGFTRPATSDAKASAAAASGGAGFDADCKAEDKMGAVGSETDNKEEEGDFSDSKHDGAVNADSYSTDSGGSGAKDDRDAKDSKPVEGEMERKQRYVDMLKKGDSLRVVRRVMEDGGESKQLVREIIELADSLSPVPVKKKEEPPASAEAEIAGPGGGGLAAMLAGRVPPTATASAVADVPKEEIADLKTDSVIGKYAKMAAMGVPGGSVAAKMKMEGIEISQQNRLLKALDMPLLSDGAAAAPAVSAAPAGGGIAAMLAGRLPPVAGGAALATTASAVADIPKEEIADLKTDSVVGKYAKMAAMGVPGGSVAAKMKMEGIEISQQNRLLKALDMPLLSDAAAAPAASAATAAPAADIPKEEIADLKTDSVIGKYAKMAAMGVPGGSVAAKMKMEGIEISQQNRLLKALDMPLLSDGAVVAPVPAEPVDVPLEELSDLKSDPVVGKYAKMAGMGVPHGSVAAKMKLDDIAISQRNRLLKCLGLPLMAEAGVGDANMAMAKPVSGIRAAMDAGPGGGPGGRGGGMQRRPSVKMQTMHWNQIPQDKLDKSIWATALDGDEKEEILDDDMKEIEKLFGVDNPKPGAKVGWADKPKKTQSAATKMLLIDGKRAQNLTIALSQYKNVAPDHFTLIRAVCALDDLGGRLKVDHLDNLQNLLPDANELKNKSVLAKSEHPAEIFLRTVASFYPDMPRRLECACTCSHFLDQAEESLSKARNMVDACNEIISSDKLARVLQKMLAVGNVMNQGTYRGNATGFTLDSLLNMIKMKGADKKTTVLDYVVKSLVERGEDRVLTVADDLSVLETCSKVSGNEIGKHMGELEDQYGKLQSEGEKVRKQQADGSLIHVRREELVSEGKEGEGKDSESKDGEGEGESESESMHTQFLAALDQRLAAFKPKMEQLAKSRKLMLKKVTEVVEYFGEDSSKCDTVSIFNVLQEFRTALRTSKEALERREKNLARANRAKSPSRT